MPYKEHEQHSENQKDQRGSQLFLLKFKVFADVSEQADSSPPRIDGWTSFRIQGP